LLGTDYERLEATITDALMRLNSPQLSAGEIEVLSILKNKIQEFESQISGIRRILMELLDNEEDLRLLYLTKVLWTTIITENS
jgi:magnesium transporter